MFYRSWFFLLLAAAAQLPAQCPTDGWAAFQAGPDLAAYKTQIGPSGSVYTVGYTIGEGLLLDAGGDSLLIQAPDSADLLLLVCKYTPSGELEWAHTLDAGPGIAIGPDISLLGNRLALGGSLLDTTGRFAGFCSLLDTAGNLLWTDTFPGTGSVNGYAVAMAPDGGVFFAGNFSKTLSLPDGEELYAGENPGQPKEAFLIKLSPTGSMIWAVQSEPGQPEASETRPRDLAVDAFGRVAMGGHFPFQIAFGNVSASSGAEDGEMPFVALFDGNDGQCLWIQAPTLVGSVYPFTRVYSLAADEAGFIYACGYLNTNLDFGTEIVGTTGGLDVLYWKIDPQGGVVHARSFGSPQTQAPEWGAEVIPTSYGTALVVCNLQAGGQPVADSLDVCIVEWGADGAWRQATCPVSGADAAFSFGAALNADGLLSIYGNSTGPDLTLGGEQFALDTARGTWAFVYRTCWEQPSRTACLEQSPGFILFPNPATDEVFLSFPDADCPDCRLWLADARGILLTPPQAFDWKRGAPRAISLESLPPGLYWIGVEAPGRKTLWQRVCRSD